MKRGSEWYKGRGGPAFATALLWIAALLLVPLSAQAQQTAPAELASFFKVGTPWADVPAHEERLDDYGISGKSYVYGAFNSSYQAIAIPESIRGYNRVDAANVAELKPGQWTVVRPSSYNYVVISLLPEELTSYINDAANTVKIWHGWSAYRAEATGLWASSNMGIASTWADRLNPLGTDIVVVGFNKTPRPTQPAEISSYGGAALNGNSAAANGTALAADEGAGRWIWVTTSANALFIIMRVAPEAPTELVDVEIWAPAATNFASRDAITLEVGTSVNLTAVLKSIGKLKSGDRDVVWSFTPSPVVSTTGVTPTAFPDSIIPDGAFAGNGLLRVTARSVGEFKVRVTSNYTPIAEGGNNTDLITITVVPPTVFTKARINVIDGGVREWTDDAPPPRSNIYLGFTADVHNGLNSFSASTRSIFRSWMDNLQELLGGKTLEYMSFLGDNGSAYQSGAAYWDSVAELMGWADEYVDSGFVGKNIFSFGNHEWYTSAGGNYRDEELQKHPAAQRLTHSGEGIVEKPKYILYPFGPVEHADASVEMGSPMIFELPEIEKLANYLATAPKNIPIFIMSHFPIHTYLTAPPFRVEDRYSTNAELLIEVLNNYPNVIFLWGHNHSSVDPLYDTVIKPGDLLLIGYGDLGETRRINFFYAGAGCMSDREYRPDLGPPNQIEGKGLLAAIDGTTITFVWYERPEAQPDPEFKLPAGLESLIEASGGGNNMKIWYDYYNYRLDAPSSSSTWNSGWYSGTVTASPYSGVGGLLSLGDELVIVGFKGSSALATADELAALDIEGYSPRITSTSGIPGSLIPGSWHVATNSGRTMIFVMLRTVTDGQIWLPGTFGGGVTVLDIVEPKQRNYYDAPYGWIKVDGDGFTWKELMDVLTTSGTPELFLNGNPVSNTAIPYTGDPAYSLKIGDAYYGVITPFKLPETLSDVYEFEWDQVLTSTMYIRANGGKPLTIKGANADVTLARGFRGPIFVVESGAKLILENIIVDGDRHNYPEDLSSLVVVRGGGEFTLSAGAVLKNNVAENGGGVLVRGGGKFTMTGGEISGNYADYGGGVYVRSSDGSEITGGEFTLIGGKIDGNYAQYEGGGVYIQPGGPLKQPGGVYVRDSGKFAMTGGAISGNEAWYGGGVSASNSEILMDGGEISGNEAWYGGGVSAAGGKLIMTGGEIVGNHAETEGGGVSIYGSSDGNAGELIVKGTAVISDNTDANVYLDVPHANLTFSVEQSFIAGNYYFDSLDLLFGPDYSYSVTKRPGTKGGSAPLVDAYGHFVFAQQVEPANISRAGIYIVEAAYGETVVGMKIMVDPGVVPNVLGQTRAAAEAAIKDLGLTVGTVTEGYSSTVASGRVISQNPTSYKPAGPGTAVDLVISLGAPTIQISPQYREIELGDPAVTFNVTVRGTDFGLVLAPGGCDIENSNTVSCLPTETGSYTVTVVALADLSIEAVATLVVKEAPVGIDQKPLELAGFDPIGSETGLWVARIGGEYDPDLDALNISGNAYVYDATGLDIPVAIRFYEYVEVDITVDYLRFIGPGQWTAFTLNGSDYVVIVPIYKKPAELAAYLPYDDGTAIGGNPSTTGGLWSLGRHPNGPYDGELDKLNIPMNAYVYGATGQPALEDGIDGYTQVDAANIYMLKPGEWALYAYRNTAYNMDLSYLVLVPNCFIESDPGPSFPPKGLEGWYDAATETAVFYGWSEYIAAGSAWSSGTMTAYWSPLADLEENAVIIGFKLSPAVTQADINAIEIEGYSPRIPKATSTAAANELVATPGSWAVENNSGRTMVFVILNMSR